MTKFGYFEILIALFSAFLILNTNYSYSNEIELVGSLEGKTEYAQYSEIIDELLRKKLDQEFKNYLVGEIHVVLIIGNDGEIEKLDYNSSNIKDEAKIEPIISTIRKMAPFPPFPSELKLPHIGMYFIYEFENGK